MNNRKINTPLKSTCYTKFFLAGWLLVSLSGCSQGGYNYQPMAEPEPIAAAENSAPVPPAVRRPDTETYNRIKENPFLDVIANPVSTFSVDVDTASYSNIRRFLNNGTLPVKNAVRIEEMVNYFVYDYPEPTGRHPFSITTEVAPAPWNPQHQLLQIGLKGKSIDQSQRPPANLVFLIDVSGSMYDSLPLVKSTLKLLTGQLHQQDRVAIVVYAGASGLVLPSTPGNDRQKILDILDQLESGGSTAGAAGIRLAYKVARESFQAGGNNRVILATDGDFNVGPHSQTELLELVENNRESGISLSVLGFGMGNYNDATAELLADKGNGSYAYIDSIREAGKVLIEQMMGTLYTIAKDVKIQMQFNPARVKSYRLIGYENRMLRKEDFADDKKDAGEIGSGHTVTALYEIIPNHQLQATESLAYVETKIKPGALGNNELMTIKFRYKQPNGTNSQLIEKPVRYVQKSSGQTSANFRFASAVAEFGLLLRDSRYKGSADYTRVLKRANSAKGKDGNGYRAEFVSLVKIAQYLKAGN